MPFTQLTREALRCYVYQLVDPRTDTPFYVGKGTGDRVFSHLDDGAVPHGDAKRETIADIRRATGRDPRIVVVAHGLSPEEALLVEAVLIRQLGLGALSNRVHGHYAEDLFLSTEDLESRHAARTYAEADIAERVLLVSLNGGRTEPPYPAFQHHPDTVARRTLGNWRVAADRARTVALVAGVYKGVVRSVFDVRDAAGAVQVGPSGLPGRLRFVGRELTEHPIRLTRIVGRDGCERTTFNPQQAFAYVGAET